MRYRTIVADPAWQYRDKLAMSDTARSASAQYRTLTVDEIKSFLVDNRQDVIHMDDGRGDEFLERRSEWLLGHVPTIADTIDDVAHLYLWITNPFLLDGTGAAVCHAWGFQPKALITWLKGTVRDDGFITGPPGMGHYTRGDTEHMILATRGAAKSLVKARNVRNWFVAPRARHSEKPDEAYALIERVSPGPYLDIFARKRRPGYDAIGDEL